MPEACLDLSSGQSVAHTLREAARANRQAAHRRDALIELPDSGRLLITGDLHDHGLNLQRILKLADLAAGPGCHLILHELIHGENRLNGMDLSIRTLARCARLKLDFPDHVHLLLSNHELAQMRGERIVKDGLDVVTAFDAGIDFLYADEAKTVRAALGDYVRSLALAVRCANGLMVSHSLPTPRKIEHFDASVLERPLEEADYEPPDGAAHLMVWGRHQNRNICNELAQRWNVETFVVGHQPAEMGHEAVADRLLILASDHGHGQALPVDLAASYSRDELVERLVPLASVVP